LATIVVATSAKLANVVFSWTLEHQARASMQRSDPVNVDQTSAQDTKAAGQPVQSPGRTADVDAAITALVRLLARQAAREHLERLANPELETTDEA
jgi:hypothetical protein